MSNTSQAGTRIDSLLDENSFVEIGAMVTARATDFNMDPKAAPSDGVITGYGLIGGSLVYVYSQDASVMGGSIGEMHAKKIINLYDLAMKTGAPVIGLIDSTGLRLLEATDALSAFGRIYRRQSMASGVIPQITAIFGSCGGGLAVFPSMSDFTFIESGKGKLFVNSPNAVEGNYTEKLDTSAAAFRSEECGDVDVVADEAEIYEKIRSLVMMLPENNEENGAFEDCTDDLNRLCSDLSGCYKDPSVALSRIADDQDFYEIKADYAKSMVTGFLRLNGITVGAVANRSEKYDDEGKVAEKFDSVLTPAGCLKAADFVSFCDAFDIPVITLTNVSGFETTMCAEKKLSKAVARLADAFASATVPKVNVITGNAFGSAYVVMNSKSLSADMTFAWDSASVGMMDADAAAKLLFEKEDNKAELTASYKEMQTSVESAARRGYIDTIIKAEDTRKYVIGALEMLFTKREERPNKKHGAI
ncbi:MAG TPA: carboxyl transferase [Lachnospiraceae bacterium]|nr:carboxyl transferase [Lachnospiraceae bacterium]